MAVTSSARQTGLVPSKRGRLLVGQYGPASHAEQAWWIAWIARDTDDMPLPCRAQSQPTFSLFLKTPLPDAVAPGAPTTGAATASPGPAMAVEKAPLRGAAFGGTVTAVLSTAAFATFPIFPV